MRKIETYERLERHINAWASGHVDPLLVVGRAGIGKSSSYSRLDTDASLIAYDGRMTALQLYCELHDLKPGLLVLDDISTAMRDRVFCDLLKQLCVSQPFKPLSWRTSTPLLEDRERDFLSPTRVLIILNELPRRNPDVMAVLDRVDSIEFDPTKGEIIHRMRQVWPSERLLIDSIERLPIDPTLRLFKKAQRWQRSSDLVLDEELLGEAGVCAHVQKLMRIMRSEPRDQWMTLYRMATGRSERSYRRDRCIAEKLLPPTTLRLSGAAREAGSS